MGVLISKADFVGKYKLANSINDEINAFISDNEEDILIDLLGNDLYNLFVLDLASGVPQTQKYLDIYNKFTVKIGCRIFQSKGMKDLLLNIIYSQYSIWNKKKQTNGGTQNNKVEVSEPSNMTFVHSFNNDGIKSYKAIQSFCLNDTVNYPEFLGTIKKYSSFI